MAESIIFTEKCNHAISSGSLHSLKSELENQLEGYTSVEISGDTTKDVDAHVLELKLKALILDTIHFIDIVHQLEAENVKTTADWIWQKQLRFQLDKKGNILIFVKKRSHLKYQCNSSLLVQKLFNSNA